ncbi:MAG TPA: adenylate/guanylate cyclase domain-containing protein [Candidatus Saccharimonadia bacterium]|nr:adenylate/guanylate cyclase domain-containing protein [Candidatus Saccharimonadia bacterium]
MTSWATPETQYAERGNIHIAYQVIGEGALDLVLVWNWFSHLEGRWDIPPYAHFLRRLAGFRRVISFDKYGIGLSDPVPSMQLPPLEEWMDDVRAVMDAVGSERAGVVGQSDGGLMAAMFAASHPDRVEAMVLIDTIASNVYAPNHPLALVWSPERYEALVELLMTGWGRPGFLAAIDPDGAQDPDQEARWARYFRLTASPATAAAMSRMLLELDMRDVLQTVRVPTLVLRTTSPYSTVASAREVASLIPGAQFVDLPAAKSLVFGGADLMADEVERFLSGTRASVPDRSRFLATVLLTDIVGSTEHAAQIGDQRWSQLLDSHDEFARRQVSRFSGTWLKGTGDGMLATFDGPARAISCAVALRSGIRSLGLELRAGIHTGEIEHRGDDVGGIGVHIAARVEAAAQPSEVLVSRTVKDLVVGSGFSFVSRGTHVLKGVPETWELFAIVE